jgi:hypothetical protein
MGTRHAEGRVGRGEDDGIDDDVIDDGLNDDDAIDDAVLNGGLDYEIPFKQVDHVSVDFWGLARLIVNYVRGLHLHIIRASHNSVDIINP